MQISICRLVSLQLSTKKPQSDGKFNLVYTESVGGEKKLSYLTLSLSVCALCVRGVSEAGGSDVEVVPLYISWLLEE